jgi:hypothetical protein
MEAVVLEGDYPNYFSLYTEKEMQVDSRYTLDPKAMSFTVDFCRYFNWEIVDNELYIVQSDLSSEHSPENMSALIVQFVNEIKPSIGRPISESKLAALTPYNEEYRTDLKCPLCSTLLSNAEDYLYCPNGDGILLKGAALLRLHAGQLTISITLLTPHGDTTTDLICPGCHNQLEKVAYLNGQTKIDSCIYCPYRWLDATDLLQIESLQKKQKLATIES